MTAVDKNPRALAFARFNAGLNSVAGIVSAREISSRRWRASVFDLLVSNPPYVISPESRYVFQDGGRPRDTLSEGSGPPRPRASRGGRLRHHRRELGTRRGRAVGRALRRWIEGNGCDTWLLRGDIQDGLTYAAVWNRGRGPSSTGPPSTAGSRTTGSPASRPIGMGAVILRRRSGGSNWVRAGRAPERSQEAVPRADPPRAPPRRIVCWLGPATPRSWQQRFRLVAEHLIRQTLRRSGDQYAIAEAEIQLTAGLPFRGTVDPYTLHLLQRCDGARTLAEVVDKLVALGRPRTTAA